jgi:hypothetical protein
VNARTSSQSGGKELLDFLVVAFEVLEALRALLQAQKEAPDEANNDRRENH